MQREPGKRDYGSSDAARLRSLASRGVPVSPTQPKPPASASPTREGRDQRARARRAHASG
ncbi:MAG: hypothetical protein ABWX83_15290 [Luteibacter sp.]